VLLITLPLAAHLKEMFSMSDRQVISVMKRVGVVAFIGKCGTDISQTLSNAQRTKAGDRLTSGDTKLCVGVPNPRPVIVITEKDGPVEAKSSFVHGAWADGPIPSQYKILRALSSKGQDGCRQRSASPISSIQKASRVTAPNGVYVSQLGVNLGVE